MMQPAVQNSSSKSLRQDKENAEEKKATLAAEIARMRAELERQQLEEDINEMEAAIFQSEQNNSKIVRLASGGSSGAATEATVSSTVTGDSEHGGSIDPASADALVASTGTGAAAAAAAVPKRKKTRRVRKVRRKKKDGYLPVSSSHSQVSSSTLASPSHSQRSHDNDQASIVSVDTATERQRLEEEIRAMEEAIAKSQSQQSQAQHQPPQQTQTPAERLEVEIRNMQTALMKAQGKRQQRLRRHVPNRNDGSNKDVNMVSQIHYVRSNDTYYDSSDEGTMDDTTLNDDGDYYEEEVLDNETVIHNAIVAARQAPAVVAQSPVRPNLMAALASAATERTQRLEETGGAPVMKNSAAAARQAPAAASKPAKPNWLAAMAVAATERVQRLEETGGELYMAEHQPEVAAQRQITPQLSTSMAEAVAKKAADRDKRIQEGGEKRMTVVKEKEQEEYKQTLASIFSDAAKLGRLTRLDEHHVEAVAGQKQAVQAWESKGLLAIQWNYRSKQMSVIHEAAAAGNAAKLPEHIVSNAPEEQRDYDYENLDHDLSPRMMQLLELNSRAGTGQNKVDSLVMGRKEERAPDALLCKPMPSYSSIEQVILPKKRTPRVDPAKAKAFYLARLKAADNEHRPLTSISNDVATLAWERRSRLDRPGQIPRVKQICSCPYCFDASPFQTVAYMVKDQQRKEEGYESPDSDEEQEQKLAEQRAARLRERQAAVKLFQPLSIREALEETETKMPVKQRIKAMNTAPTVKTVKPVQSAVINDYRRPDLPPPKVVATPPPPPAPPRVVPSQTVAPALVSPPPVSPTATELLEAEIREMQNALLKAEEEEARVPTEPKSVASKMRSVVGRKNPRGPKSVASKSPSVASRQKPVPRQGSVRGRPMSVAASRQKSVGSKRRKPATKEPAPSVPRNVEITIEADAPKAKVIRHNETKTLPFQGSRQQNKIASANKSVACTIM